MQKISEKIDVKPINLKAFWDSFPQLFRKKFKDFDILDKNSFMLTANEMFDGETEEYFQMLEFNYEGNNKMRVGMSTLGEDSGTDGLSQTFGTFNIDKESIEKIMQEVNNTFGN